MVDAYELLRKRKMSGESFSELIRRSFNQKRDIMEFAGAWKNISDKDIKDMKSFIEKHDKKETEKLLKKYQK